MKYNYSKMRIILILIDYMPAKFFFPRYFRRPFDILRELVGKRAW